MKQNLRGPALTLATLTVVLGLLLAVTVANGQSTVLRRGEFYSVQYDTRGHAALQRTDSAHAIQLEDDFMTQSGLPGLVVWLSAAEEPQTEADVLSDYVGLGDLASPTGAQTYPVEAGIDVAEYNSVVIWCEPFSVLVGAASLREVATPTATTTVATSTATVTLTPSMTPAQTATPTATLAPASSPTVTPTLTPSTTPTPEQTAEPEHWIYLPLLLRQE